MNLADHICELPTGKKLWWTCDQCGQLWHRDSHKLLWKLTMREATDA